PFFQKKLKILESDDAIWAKNEIKRQCGNLTINDDSVDDSMQAILSTTISTSNSNVELARLVSSGTTNEKFPFHHVIKFASSIVDHVKELSNKP
ncbi:9367_t:CDS:2, partial [Entrophospora sp. SA101]